MGRTAEHSTPLPLGLTMSIAPFDLELRYDSIDTTDYPETAKDIQSDAFKQELRQRLEQQYRSLGGNLIIEPDSSSVRIHWNAGTSLEQQKSQAMQLLQSGNIPQAQPILQSILNNSPEDTDTLYNLGMIYSDQGKLDEAIALLNKATQTDSKHNHAFVALGVAKLRHGQIEAAETALKQALDIDSDDPYALRTLAVLHMQKEDHISAISVLRHSLSLLPDDSVSLLNLGLSLFKTGQSKNISEAGDIANLLIANNTGNEIETKAKDLQRQVAQYHFRESSGKHENSDAVFACIDAMRKLKDASQKEIAAVALEIAQLGQSGIKVNNPEVTYTIKSFPGNFSGLALVCLLHVAVQKVSPGSDSGFDVQKEYEIAKGLFEGKKA